MIYLNNAATSYPKPFCVKEAVQACLEGTPVSQFRGGSEIGKKDMDQLCRENLGKLFGIKDISRIWFTSGATEALNMLLCGAAKREAAGDILVTWTEHNSVLRPVMNQEVFRKFRIIEVPCDEDGMVSEASLEASVTPQSRILIVNHCSNVTGCVQDMEMIGEFARRYQLVFLTDVSQSAGCIPVCADQWGVDGLAFTAHKGLYGIQGCGGFYLRTGYDIAPLKYGGTGRDSARLTYEDGAFEYEVGTQNMPGIAGLYAGTQFVLQEGVSRIMEREAELMQILEDGLYRIPGIILYGRSQMSGRQYGPVLSLNFKGLKASDAAYILQNVYGITVRAGLHCSPLIYRALGMEQDGTVRVSVSYFTTEEEIRAFLEAAEEICVSLQGQEKNAVELIG